jgi:hypothetical protein
MEHGIVNYFSIKDNCLITIKYIHIKCNIKAALYLLIQIGDKILLIEEFYKSQNHKHGNKSYKFNKEIKENLDKSILRNE